MNGTPATPAASSRSAGPAAMRAGSSISSQARAALSRPSSFVFCWRSMPLAD